MNTVRSSLERIHIGSERCQRGLRQVPRPLLAAIKTVAKLFSAKKATPEIFHLTMTYLNTWHATREICRCVAICHVGN